MWRNRKYYEGLIAKSLYEPLSDRENARLEKAMAADSSLRDDQVALTSVVNRLPAESEPDAPDLLPDLRIAIATEKPDSAWRWSAYLPRKRAATLVVALGVPLAIFVTQLPALFEAEQPPVVEYNAQVSVVKQAIQQAESLVDEHKPGEAMRFLTLALTAQPNDVNAPDARLLLAELAFNESAYDQAFDAYAHLQANDRAYVASLPDERRAAIADRFELLDECRADNYETLLAYDAAMRESSDRFARLEQVAARASADPHGVLASRTVWAMADAVEGGGDFGARLERVRDRCENPLVAARASYEAGRMYESESQDIERAAAAYRMAATHSVYEEAAGDALARLAAR